MHRRQGPAIRNHVQALFQRQLTPENSELFIDAGLRGPAAAEQDGTGGGDAAAGDGVMGGQVASIRDNGTAIRSRASGWGHDRHWGT